MNYRKKPAAITARRSLSLLCALSALAIFTGAATAETLFVTDVLQLGVHATSDLSTPAFRNLKSGAEVEVLERRGRYAQIRIDDGSIGWVKSLYLVPEAPARTRLTALENENTALESSVERLRTQLGERDQKLKTLEQEQASVTSESSLAQAELAQLRTENQSLLEQVQREGLSVSLRWVLILMLIMVAAGAGGGWWWVDRRSRARHGGFRVY